MRKSILYAALCFLSISVKAQNCTSINFHIHTIYATCGDTTGTLFLEMISSGDYYFFWSTGSRGSSTDASPGYHSVLVVDSLTGDTCRADSIRMWHEEMDIWLEDFGAGELRFGSGFASGCACIFRTPQCFVDHGEHDYYVIVWEDGVPIDTVTKRLTVISGYYEFSSWCCYKPGHYYDMSVSDPLCGCNSATWMYNPPRTIIIPPTGVNEISNSSSIKVSNPFDDVLNIQVDNHNSKNFPIELVDVSGSIVFSSNISLSPGKQDYNFALPSLSEGIYFLRSTFGFHKLVHFSSN